MKESKYACVGILSMVVALSLSSCSTSTYTVRNRPESFTYSPTSDGKKDTSYSYSYSEADKGEQKGEKKKEKEKEEKTPDNLQDILTERYSTFTPAECLKGIEPESCLDVIIREAETVFLSRETGISGNFVGRIKGAKCPFDLQFLTWDFS